MNEGEEAAVTPVPTGPLDELEQGAWFDGEDTVAALRVLDGELELELPRAVMGTLGASRRCDLSIAGLSAVHCVLERRGDRLRVHDRHSTHGCFARGRKFEKIELVPGDTFTAAPVELLVMSREMRTQRPILAELLAAGTTPSPDRLLIEAVTSSRHVLITGEHGCDAERLARAIHGASLRRVRPLVGAGGVPGEAAALRELIAAAARSTLVLDLTRARGPADPAHVAALLAPEHHVRVIVIAPTVARARRVLGTDRIAWLIHVALRPVRQRRAELPALLDRLLAERHAPRRFAELAPENRTALVAAEWRDNLAGLRLAADRLAAIARTAEWDSLDWRERASAIGMPKSTLHDWFGTLGLAVPLFVPAPLPAPAPPLPPPPDAA